MSLAKLSPRLFTLLIVLVVSASHGPTAGALTYDDAATGNWTAATTWDLSGSPVSGDEIIKDGNFQISVTGNQEFGGTGTSSFWTTSGTQGSNVLSVSTGVTLTHLAGGTMTYRGHGPNIIGSGTFINQGTFIHEGNSSGGDLDLYAKFNNFGTYSFTGTNQLQFVQMDGSSGVWRNESGGLITKTGSTYDAGFWDYNNTDGAQFINDGGDITLPTGGGLLYIQDGSNANPHQSTGGTFSTAAGTTLELSGFWSEITANATGAGDVLVAGGNGNLEVPTIDLTVNVTGNGVKWTAGTIDTNSGQTLTNAGIFTIAGGGTKTLAGTGTFHNTGTLTVDTGTTFEVPSAADLSLNAGTINGGGTLLLGTTLTSTGTSAVSVATLDLDGGVRTFSIPDTPSVTDALTVSSQIINGGITKTGPGSLTLSGSTSNTYTGLTTVSGGTLRLNKSATSTINAVGGDLTINSGAVILDQNHQIADTSNITVNGSAYFNSNNRVDTVASMTLNSTYNGYTNYRLSNITVTGTLEMTDGTAGLNSSSSLNVQTALDMSGGSRINFAANAGNTTINVGSGGLTMSGANIHMGWGTLTSGRVARVNLNGDFTGSGTNLFDYYTTAGPRLLDLRGATRTFDITDGTTTIDVTVINGGLTKTGAGTLILSAGDIGNSTYGNYSGNTYTLGTTVSGGTLLANNPTGSGTGSGAVLVNGGTLGGTGTISGPVTVSSGSLAPGTSPGILTLEDGVTFAGGSFAVELNGTTVGTQYDQLLVTGGNVALGSGVASLDVTTGFTPGQDDFFWIIRNETGTTTGNFAGLAGEGSSFVVDGTTFYIYYHADFASGDFLGSVGNDVLLTTIPEPSTLAMLLGLGGIGLLGYLRRRTK